MYWSKYEIFSVISGLILMAIALWPDSRIPASNRFWAFVGGAFFTGYGIYVASQVSGTYYFSGGIFIVPFGAAIYLISLLLARKRDHSNGR